MVYQYQSPLPLSMIDIPLSRDTVGERREFAALLLRAPRAFITVIRISESPSSSRRLLQAFPCIIGAFPSTGRGSSEEFNIVPVQKRRIFGSRNENYEAEQDKKDRSHLKI
ncbi:hypothetical protein PENTCL1PPCAC_13546, partial [Pristionchus entomophagus]